MLGAAGATAAIGIGYLFSEGFHSTTQRVIVAGELVDSRPIVAAGALLILQGILVAVGAGWPTPGTSKYVLVLGGGVLIATQQRTVWVAAAICGLIGFLRWSKANLRYVPSQVYGLTGVLVIATPPLLWLLARSAALRTSVSETTATHSTLRWRIESWRELIVQHHSLGSLTFGEPSGASWARQVFGGAVTEVSAHSFYVEALLRFGVIGCVVLVAFGIAVARGRSLVAESVGLPQNTVALLLVTQAVFAFTYMMSPLQGLILGIFAAGLIPHQAHSPATEDAERLSHAVTSPAPQPRFS
jgi:hypothetical protein